MAKRKTGKSETTKPVIIDGKKMTGEIVELVNVSAKNKKQSVAKFIRENKEAIKEISDKTFIDFDVRTDELVNYIQGLNKRSFTIDDGNGLVKHSKKETIRAIMDYVNYVKTNSEIDFLFPHAVITYDGNVTVSIPDGYNKVTGDDLTELLEAGNVEYFEYDKKIAPTKKQTGTIKQAKKKSNEPKTIKTNKQTKTKRRK